MEAILKSHPVKNLRSEIKKQNDKLGVIKGYWKKGVTKNELVSMMMKHKERFNYIKMYEKPKRKAPVKKEKPKTEKPKSLREIKKETLKVFEESTVSSKKSQDLTSKLSIIESDIRNDKIDEEEAKKRYKDLRKEIIEEAEKFKKVKETEIGGKIKVKGLKPKNKKPKKKERSAKQKANDKKLGEMAKKRAEEKKGKK